MLIYQWKTSVRTKTEVENVRGKQGNREDEKQSFPDEKAYFWICVYVFVSGQRHMNRENEWTKWSAFHAILNDPVFVRSLSLGNTQACHFSYMKPFLNLIHTWNYNRKWITAITTWMSDNIWCRRMKGKKKSVTACTYDVIIIKCTLKQADTSLVTEWMIPIFKDEWRWQKTD